MVDSNTSLQKSTPESHLRLVRAGEKVSFFRVYVAPATEPSATEPLSYMSNCPIMLGVWLVGGDFPRIADVRDWFPAGKGVEKGGEGA